MKDKPFETQCTDYIDYKLSNKDSSYKKEDLRWSIWNSSLDDIKILMEKNDFTSQDLSEILEYMINRYRTKRSVSEDIKVAKYLVEKGARLSRNFTIHPYFFDDKRLKFANYLDDTFGLKFKEDDVEVILRCLINSQNVHTLKYLLNVFSDVFTLEKVTNAMIDVYSLGYDEDEVDVIDMRSKPLKYLIDYLLYTAKR